MPIIPTFNNSVGDMDRSILLVTWVLLTATPDGLGVEIPEWGDRMFTFGEVAGDTLGGAVGNVEGSNDGITWYSCRNAAGGGLLTLAFTALSTGAAVVENPRFMRPILSTVGVAASVTVRLCARRQNTMRT